MSPDSNNARNPSEPAVGAFSFIDSPPAVEILANAGFDWICLDQQHGRHNDASVLETIGLLAGHESTSIIVRVRELNAGLIGRALDGGARGVIVPMIQSAAEATRLVQWALYPPQGARSYGPIRGAYGADVTNVGAVNDSLMLAAMIETSDALAVVDEIAAVPGLTMLFVGPFDLALALGTTVDQLLSDDNPDSPLARIVRAAGAHSLVAGVYAGTPERATRLAEIGFSYIAASSDTAALDTGARTATERTMF